VKHHRPTPEQDTRFAGQAAQLLAEIDRDTATLLELGEDALALPPSGRAILEATAAGKDADPAKVALAFGTDEQLCQTNAWKMLHALRAAIRESRRAASA
jgi:hypothetical protein